MPPRRILVVALTGLLALAGPPAAAPAASPAKLTVTSVSSPPRTLARGAEFTVRGRVANRGGRTASALMSFTLRSSAKSKKALSVGGGRVARRIRPGRTLRYTARLRLDPRLGENRSYVLVACVRTKRGARPACRAARRRTTLSGPRASTAPGAAPAASQPAPAPGSPASLANDTSLPGPRPSGASGARSLGDRLFPGIGNGGYDVQRYDLAIDYTPATRRLAGVATITAVATQDLSDFSLDLVDWMTVSAVTVDGASAGRAQDPAKLLVFPSRGIAAGRTFTVVVTYAGTAKDYIDPDGSSEGWAPTSDGAFVVGEPVGAMAWFPNNNHPTDKALYDLRVTVPDTVEVIGNGRLVANTAVGGKRTWHWREDSPMATYLVTATTGQFDITTDMTDPTLPSWRAVDSAYSPIEKAIASANLGQDRDMLAWLKGKWGTYPFSSTGGIVDNAPSGAAYALESQTRPNYPDATLVTEETYLHELAHQWYGDSVSPATWSDVWLNEGPAEFSSWWWQEEERGNVANGPEAQFDKFYATSDDSFWEVPPAAPPTAADLFNTDAMYNRGAMVIQALREILGETVFLDMMRAWEDAHSYAHASTAQFIAHVKSKGDPAKAARFDEFFAQWLYGTTKPTITPDTF